MFAFFLLIWVLYIFCLWIIYEINYSTQIGFRTHCPKIWHLGTWIFKSWRNLRNGMFRKDFLFSLEAVIKPACCHVRDGLPISGKEHPCLQEWCTERKLNEQALLSLPQFTVLTLHPLFYIFHSSPPFIKPNIKTLIFNYFLMSPFPYEGSWVMKHIK